MGLVKVRGGRWNGGWGVGEGVEVGVGGWFVVGGNVQVDILGSR